MNLTKAPSWYSIIVCLLKNMMGGKTKGGSKMKTQKTKQNIIVVAKATLIAGFVSIALYLGVPELSVSDVLSLGSLTIAFALAVLFIKK